MSRARVSNAIVGSILTFLERVLEKPSYGYRDPNGKLYVPTTSEIFREFLHRVNPLVTKKNWLTFWGWFTTLALAPVFLIFLFNYFSFKLALIGFVYSMVFLGSHGTFWLHRYSTHRAFRFRNSFWRFLGKNLVIKLVPEETYVISHLVHHQFSDVPGDPYNAQAGFLYCFFADSNHQLLNRNLSEADYKRARHLINHTGVYLNSYEQYQKWGSIQHPVPTVLTTIFNWVFWYGMFFLIGGHELGIAIFGVSVIWAVGIRTFNFEGHGKGKDRRRPGIDFNTEDFSVNQMWPGIVAGEWHSNHHLFPRSARCGFLWYQIDLPWSLIRTLALFGGVNSFLDDREAFLKQFFPANKNIKDSINQIPKSI